MRRGCPRLDLTGTGYCASFNFRRTARAVTRLYDLALQPSGIRSTQFAILVGIAKSRPISIGGLADLLLIDRTTLTRSLRLMQKEGLLSVSERSSKRQRFLNVTPKGERTLARSLPYWRQAQERFVNAVGTDYWIHMQSELERLSGVALRLENSEENAPRPASTAS